MKIIKSFFIFVLTLAFSYGVCQKPIKTEKPETLNRKFIKGTENRTQIEKADVLFNKGEFSSALPVFQDLEKIYPEELYLKFKIGACYLNKKNEHNFALPYLEKVFQAKPRLNNINLYLGQAYFYNYKFSDALDQFKLLLGKTKDSEQTSLIQHYIDNCVNAIELVANPVDVEIKNIGKTVNTEAQEYAPVISSDESVLMFTYRGPKSTGGLQNNKNKPDPNGEFYEDIFVSTKDQNQWQEPVSIGTNINGNGHDACIALSNDGQKLFIYKFTSKDLGDIYISQLIGSIWSAPKRLKGKVNTKFWEGSASLSSDGKTLFFSSSNPRGGYGGKDLYRASLQADGSWGNVQNLGDEINTPYDDDGPFIHPDGKILLFSSKGHNSMGGYDILRSNLLNDSVWSSPVNMGYPINTIEDELYYELSASGKTGYYSSGKPGGSGGQDIYIVEPGLAGKRALILVKGIVTKDGTPAESEITVEFSDPNNTKEYTNQSEFNSNSATGKYLINFPAGNSYKVTYRLSGFKDHIEIIDASGIEDFEVRIIPVAFSSKEESGEKKEDLLIATKAQHTKDSIQSILNKQADLVKAESLQNLKKHQLDSILLAQQQRIEIVKKDSIQNAKNHEASAAKKDSAFAVHKAIAKAKSDSVIAQKQQILLAKTDSLRAIKQQKREIAKQDSIKHIEQKKEALAKVASIKAAKELAQSEEMKKNEHDTSSLNLDFFLAKDLNNPVTYKTLVEKVGAITVDGLLFKVQVGAYRHPKNFKYDQLNEFGEVEITNFPDKITRFTLKQFKTIAEAEAFRQQVIQKGFKDAWITAVYKGERKLLEELIISNFYKGKELL